VPTRIIRGERIGKQGRIRTGCSAVIFSPDREKVLLTRRTDNGLWCLPGGGIDPGESAAETCAREVLEETGLRARVTRLIGVYSSPDWLVEYPDGNRVQLVALSFEAALEGGELTTTSEVSEYGYFSLAEISELDLMLNHQQRILDAFAGQPEAFVR
jgi:8-oxo-dGTP pyrophosphatase MutT (NUDIX family)